MSPEIEAGLRQLTRSLEDPNESAGSACRPGKARNAGPAAAADPELSAREQGLARRGARWLAEEGPSPAYFALRLWLRQDPRRRGAYSAALEELVNTLVERTAPADRMAPDPGDP